MFLWVEVQFYRRSFLMELFNSLGTFRFFCQNSALEKSIDPTKLNFKWKDSRTKKHGFGVARISQRQVGFWKTKAFLVLQFELSQTLILELFQSKTATVVNSISSIRSECSGQISPTWAPKLKMLSKVDMSLVMTGPRVSSHVFADVSIVPLQAKYKGSEDYWHLLSSATIRLHLSS